MNQLLSIVDDKLVIDKLRVKFTEGSLTHAGSLEVVGTSQFNEDVSIAKNINVVGSITADTINVKHIITEESGGVRDPFAFTANTEQELDGKGFHFTDGLSTRLFVYKEGGRLWSTVNLDLANERSYCIDQIPVLSAEKLGSSVVHSNLQTVGKLHKLQVAGAVSFGEWAFFNHIHSRLGINTDSPNGSIGIQENNVDLVLGSYKNDYGYIGTFNNTNLELGTDNTARITLRSTGEIDIGHAKYKNAVVRVYGKLEVDDLINHNAKTEPLYFKATKDSTIYGTGIVWSQDNSNRQFTYAANPDRIWSSETIDLSDEKYYSINGNIVLSKNSLGDSVTSSSLTKLGALESLVVGGEANLRTVVNVGANNEIVLTRDHIKFNDNNQLTITGNGLSVAESFTINCDSEQEFKIESNGAIELGNRHNTNRRVSMYGQVSVGVSNPESDVAFTVGGAVNLNGKKFVKGTTIPSSGRYSVGDICWNTQPEATSYVGWICIREGTPGEWLPFGQIVSQ